MANRKAAHAPRVREMQERSMVSTREAGLAAGGELHQVAFCPSHVVPGVAAAIDFVRDAFGHRPDRPVRQAGA